MDADADVHSSMGTTEAEAAFEEHATQGVGEEASKQEQQHIQHNKEGLLRSTNQAALLMYEEMIDELKVHVTKMEAQNKHL